MNTTDDSELPSQALTAFVCHQRNIQSCNFLMEIMHFLLTNSDTFYKGLPSVGITGSKTNRSVFQKELIIEHSLPIPPYTQHYFLWTKAGLWCGWWWFTSLAP